MSPEGPDPMMATGGFVAACHGSTWPAKRRPTAPGASRPSEAPVERARLRQRIDDVDARISALLEERAELAVAVQQTRGADDHGHDVERERQLIERAATSDGGVLTAEEREAVFASILRVSRSAQRRHAAEEAASGVASPAAANGMNP